MNSTTNSTARKFQPGVISAPTFRIGGVVVVSVRNPATGRFDWVPASEVK